MIAGLAQTQVCPVIDFDVVTAITPAFSVAMELEIVFGTSCTSDI